MISVVTGATGCLGLSLTRRLLHEGHEVVALGRNLQKGALLSQMGAQFVRLDLRDAEGLKKIASKADLMFHCAALSSPWGTYADFYQANVIGTRHVIEATPKSARLIHVSSPSIYFDFTEKHQIKENQPLPFKAANHYIKTKRLAESLIDKAFNEHKINVVTIRPRAIFGPHDNAILPRLLGAEKKGVLPIIGRGGNVMDITYVDNVSDALLLAAKAEKHVLGKKYNITNDAPRTLHSILDLLFHTLGKPLKLKHIPYSIARILAFSMEKVHQLGIIKGEPLLTQYSVGVLALGQTLNIDAAKQDLNYKPLISMEQGMEEFANWYLPS